MGNPIIDPEMGIYTEDELKEQRKKFDDAFAALMEIVSKYNKGEAYLGDVDKAVYKLIRYGKPRLGAQFLIEETAPAHVTTNLENINEFLLDGEDKLDGNEYPDDKESNKDEVIIDKKKMLAVRTEMMKLWNSTTETPFSTDNRDLYYDTKYVDNNNINAGVMNVNQKLGLEKSEIEKKVNKLWICAPGSMEPISIKREGHKFTVRENCSTMEMYADLHRQKMVAPKPPKDLLNGILNRLSKAFLGRPSKAFRDYARAMARYTCSQNLESYGKRNLGLMGIKEADFPNIEGVNQAKVTMARGNLVSMLQLAGPATKILWKNIWRRLDDRDTKVLDLLASKDTCKGLMNAIYNNDACNMKIGGSDIHESMIDIDASVDYIRSLSDKLTKLPETDRKSELDYVSLDKSRCRMHLKKTKAYNLIIDADTKKTDDKAKKTEGKHKTVAEHYTKEIYDAFTDALDYIDIYAKNDRGSILNSRLGNYTVNELDKLYLAYAKLYVSNKNVKPTNELNKKDDVRKKLIGELTKVVEKNKPSKPLFSLKEDIDKRAKDLLLNEQSGAGSKVTEQYKKARKTVVGLFGNSVKSKAKKTDITNENAFKAIEETIKSNENFKVFGLDDKIEGFKNLFKEALESNNTEAVKFAKNVADWNGDDIYNLYLQYFERPETISKCILNPSEAQLAASENTNLTYSKEEWKHEKNIDKASEQLANKQEKLEQGEMNKNQPGKSNDEPENVVVGVPVGPGGPVGPVGPY